MTSALGPADRLIMFVLIHRADTGSGTIPPEFSPSLSTLASETGLGRSTVAERLNHLEEAGWVGRVRPTKHEQLRHNATTAYVLAPGRGPEDTDPEVVQQPDGGGPAAGPGVVRQPDGGGPGPGPGLVQQPDGPSPGAGHNLSSLQDSPISPPAAAADAHDACDASRVTGRDASRVTSDRCPMCDREDWLHEIGRRIPVTPYTKCDHTTDHRTQVARVREAS